ncbi:MAG: glutamate-5-semialdehyde dehydrogenase [Cyanobacteriota bacterium]|jgi:glutamate-5-semialdehyde dehydrogenase
MTENSVSNLLTTALESAQQAFFALAQFSGADRNRGLRAMAKGLEEGLDLVLEANTLDLETSRDMAVPPGLVERLKLTPDRLLKAVELLEQLADLPDPLQRVINAPYQLNPSQTYCQLMPLGVVALIYEAFPELGAITAGFCLKTGNSLVLRGCGASSYSTAAIVQLLQESLRQLDFPAGSISHLPSDEAPVIQDLVSQTRYLNLILPYGGPSLVEQVAQQATLPVLKAALGNCYLYWSAKGDLELVRWMILDSHASEPDPVNAIEKVLLSPALNDPLLILLFNNLQEKGFQLRGDAELCEAFPNYLSLAKDSEWSKPYLQKIIAFRAVPDLGAAVGWINRHSSGHADCIATESYLESRQFASGVDSALVYINASPRFSRNPKQGESIFLGISNQKGHRRGLIGLETFTTLKQVVQGSGKLPS